MKQSRVPTFLNEAIAKKRTIELKNCKKRLIKEKSDMYRDEKNGKL